MGFADIVLILALSFPQSGKTETNRVEREGNIEALKNYFSSPPAVSVAVVRANNTLAAVPASAVQGNSHVSQANFVTFQGARQGSDFYVRQVLTDADEGEPFGTNTVDAGGCAGTTAWQEGRAGSLRDLSYVASTKLGESDNLSFLAVSNTNKIAQFASIRGNMYSRYLDLGLIDVKRGSFQFSGNTFKVRLNRGSSAEGEFLTNNGQVVAIRFHILGDAPYVVSEFQYSSNDSVPSFLPSKVVQKVYRNGSLVKTNMEFEILRLKLSTEPLAQDHFLPDRFSTNKTSGDGHVMIAGKTIELELTNGILYNQSRGKLLAQVRSSSVAQGSPFRSAVFCSIISLITLCFIVFASRLNKNKQNQKK